MVYAISEYYPMLNSVLKVGDRNEREFFSKMRYFALLNTHAPSNSAKTTTVYYHSGGRYFRKCLLKKLSIEYKPLDVKKGTEYQIVALLSSSLYYWFWLCTSDCYHVTKPDIQNFRVPNQVLTDADLAQLGKDLLEDVWKNRREVRRNRADGSTQTEVQLPLRHSKQIIDDIDRSLAKHYDFTDEELDFIINYDIKYRMGRESGLDRRIIVSG